MQMRSYVYSLPAVYSNTIHSDVWIVRSIISLYLEMGVWIDLFESIIES